MSNYPAGEWVFGARSILAWLSISTIFMSGLYIHTPAGNFHYFYVVMMVAYGFLVAKNASLGLRVEVVWIVFAITIVSILGMLVTADYGFSLWRIGAMFTKIGMLSFFIVFYASIYVLCGRSTVVLFFTYLKVAKFFACLGILQQIIYFLTHVDVFSFAGGAKDYGAFLGVAGLSVEPAFYACALLPAGAYYTSMFAKELRTTMGGSAVIIAILLSTSSLGYIGLFISASISYFMGISIKRIWAIAVTIPICFFAASSLSGLDFFQLRWGDTIAVLKGEELTMKGGMNISTYANAVNVTISMTSIRDNYGAGVGFGMYSMVFDKYISQYEMPGYRDELPGRGSATSLFARLTAELGVAAWGLFAVMLYWCFLNIRKSFATAIGIAYFSTMLIILLRMGEYYANGVLLAFLMIYWLRLETVRTARRASFPQDDLKRAS